MRYTLGIDFGGGAAKATLLCADGQIAATHTVEYPTARVSRIPPTGGGRSAPARGRFFGKGTSGPGRLPQSHWIPPRIRRWSATGI